MAQFDVYVNPIAEARRAYPFVVELQSDLTDSGHDRIVAPLVLQASMPNVAGRLTPIAVLDAGRHVVLIPAMAGVRRSDLGQRIGSLHSLRSELLAAIDLLFFGV